MDDVSVEFLGSLHGTTATAVKANKLLKQLYDNGNQGIYVPLAYQRDTHFITNKSFCDSQQNLLHVESLAIGTIPILRCML